MLRELMHLPKKLTVFQDEPLRTDQGGTMGASLPKLCKCRTALESQESGKTLCSCGQSEGLPYFQQQNTPQQWQHSDADQMGGYDLDQHSGAQFGATLQQNDHIHGALGELQLEMPEHVAHADYMGIVDSDEMDILYGDL